MLEVELERLPRTALISSAATTAPGQISRVFGRGLGSTR